ncbi:DNA polymerase III subunit gamma/tau [Alphaproteobacteria bacterium LSUCC0684]
MVSPTDPEQLGKPVPDMAYRVLARKYRPSTFDELIGQESLVTTLSNALKMGRLAHAFVLTGLRGIGKTTTARIIARGLNCTGEDGQGGPTLSPCGVCSSCTGIAEGRHVDVIEMDAASNTGVDDVREIIEGVGYRPLSARFKIYIIDEVHMLSKSAFNALLKTLEEPPEAVKFIFATTEIRKVPVTVLSRCQRFDLRRVPVDRMVTHLQHICEQERIKADEMSLIRIARAAEGSVRDALSMLDQAAALTADQITDEAVATLLGQAGRQDALAITEEVLSGQAPAAMESLAQAVGRGAEPQMVLRDMLDLLHLACRLAAGGEAADLPQMEQETLARIADTCGIARLVRAWQITLKGHGELALAPDPKAAADMVLIRLAYAANMPSPADLVQKIENSISTSAAAPAAAPSTPATSPVSLAPVSGPLLAAEPEVPVISASRLEEPAREVEPEARDELAQQTGHDAGQPEAPASGSMPPPENMRAMANHFESQGELLLAATIRTRLRCVRFEPGQFEFSTDADIDPAVPRQIATQLLEWTGLRWIVSISSEKGGPTIDEQDQKKKAQDIAAVSEHPLVAATLTTFPGASVAEIRPVANPLEAPPPEEEDGFEEKGEINHA